MINPNASLLTVGEIRSVARTCKYLFLTNYKGFSLTVNSRVVFLGSNKNKPDSKITDFISASPCDFHTYIFLKTPF